MLQRLKTQEVEKALQLIHKANKEQRDLPIPQELQKLEPIEWVLLEQMLEMILLEKDQKRYIRCKKERRRKRKGGEKERRRGRRS